MTRVTVFAPSAIISPMDQNDKTTVDGEGKMSKDNTLVVDFAAFMSADDPRTY